METRRGFALATAMMLLALLSVLGAVAIQSTTLEVKISGYDQDGRVALYVAESALEEAKYYASRGWGKIQTSGSRQVQVETPPIPGLSWGDNRYANFTLVDRLGQTFTVQSHTNALQPTLTLVAGDPAPGRFFLIRQSIVGAWSGTDLAIADADWANASPPNAWAGWLLWSSDPVPMASVVKASSVTVPGELRLTVTDPGLPPYTLSQNPWLSALANRAASLPGDRDPATPAAWDRRFFADPAGTALGDGQVAARWVRPPPPPNPPGQYAFTYELTATGIVGPSTRQAWLTVYRAGRPDQWIGDWVVQ